jgi:maleylacetate reductase
VAEFIAGLGLPRSLAEVGVSANQFPLLAENTMGDSWTYSNPRKISGPEDVLRILAMAA